MNSKMKKIIAVIAAIGIATIGVFWFMNQKDPIANSDSKGTTIVAFGDSLVFGYGSTKGNDFVSLLSNDIGQPIINLGKSGDTTASALTRIDTALEQNPKVVIVLLGGNDFLRSVPQAQTFANLSTIIERIQSKGSAVILLGVRGGIFSDAYEADYQALAEKYQTGYVPNVLNGLLGNKQYMSDAIHPNDAGYVRVADKVLPELKRVLEEIDNSKAN